jgi:riboflavin kinase/FMN adenylyltransferase
MDVLRYVDNRKLSIPKPILTMGNFDGVHLGHQALLRRIIQDAREVSGRSVVLTFKPHPLKILSPARAPRSILTYKDKLTLLRSAGVDIVIMQKFSLAFANLESRDFVRRYLVDQLNVHRIWVGRDFRFGKNRTGHVDELVQWGADAGFEVRVVDLVEDEDKRISSSRIRDLIARGEVHRVNRFLGRCHFVTGRVVRGRQRGRHLGFPTANILSKTEVIPADGIYATFLQIRGQYWASVTNIGHNPTFGEGPRTVESYILDFQGDLYGHQVRLFFIEKIRDEKRFPSAELLVAQMKYDVRDAQEVFRKIDVTKMAELRG